jgi:hypothetical protein
MWAPIFLLGRSWEDIFYVVRFVAFPATEYDEVLSGYQPSQMVEQ